ncbi:hypothetical protein KY290_027386 [Solanum tuberosum]|uniref:Uncharacterized protein n=1 Tax=Solanum tuberosum TaxID=4113 RepID=A0ABQ7UF03_SOLTU|nr:hypothetical protein KY290_027386 [Solanum tuberosum]
MVVSRCCWLPVSGRKRGRTVRVLSLVATGFWWFCGEIMSPENVANGDGVLGSGECWLKTEKKEMGWALSCRVGFGSVSFSDFMCSPEKTKKYEEKLDSGVLGLLEGF